MDSPKPLQSITLSDRVQSNTKIYQGAKYWLSNFKKERWIEKELYGFKRGNVYSDDMINVKVVGTVAVSAMAVFATSLPLMSHQIQFNIILLATTVSTIIAGVIFNLALNKRLRKERVSFEEIKMAKSAEFDVELNRNQRALYNPDLSNAFDVYTEVSQINHEIDKLNSLLKNIDDFRPLTDEEKKDYNSLVERRKKVGLKMIEVEKQLAEPKEVRALLPIEVVTPQIVSPEPLNRHQLENELAIQIKQIEAAETQRQAAEKRRKDIESQLEAIKGNRLIA